MCLELFYQLTASAFELIRQRGHVLLDLCHNTVLAHVDQIGREAFRLLDFFTEVLALVN